MIKGKESGFKIAGLTGRVKYRGKRRMQISHCASGLVQIILHAQGEMIVSEILAE